MASNYATLAEAVAALLRAQQQVKRAKAALHRAEYSTFGQWDQEHRLGVLDNRLHTAQQRQARAEERLDSLSIELGIDAPMPEPSLSNSIS